MKRGQLATLALLQPIVVFALLAAVVLLLFGGLGLVNSVTSLLGIDLLRGSLSGVLRVAALFLAVVIGFFVAVRLPGLGLKEMRDNFASLMISAALAVFLVNFSLTGNLPFSAIASGGSFNATPFSSAQLQDYAVGVVIGVAVSALFLKARKKAG